MGKNPLLISLFFYDYLQIKFVSFLKVWPATIPCKRKTIKWATTLDIRKKGKGKKERSSARKNKKLLHYILLVGKYVLVDAKLSFCRSLANWPKTSPKKGIGEQCGFFRFSLAFANGLTHLSLNSR